MIPAIKAERHPSSLYSGFIVHQFLDIKDDDLILNVLFLQLDRENFIRMLSHVDVHSKTNLVWGFPEIKLYMRKDKWGQYNELANFRASYTALSLHCYRPLLCSASSFGATEKSLIKQNV